MTKKSLRSLGMRSTVLLFVAAVLGWGCGSGSGTTTGNGGEIPPPPDTGGNPKSILKIFVPQDGIYKLTYDALKSAGFNVAGASPNDLKLTQFIDGTESEVPLRIVGGEDGRLDSGDFVEFYGTAIPRGDRRFEFTETNVYRLKGEAGSRKRITTKSHPFGQPSVNETSFSAVLHVEEDTHYWQNMPDEDPFDGFKPDRWMWGSPFSRGEARDAAHCSELSAGCDYSFFVYNPDPGSHILLKFRFQARTDYPGHQVSVYLNSTENLIATQSWDGLIAHEFTVDITDKGFVPGNNGNRLRIENSGDNDLSQYYLVWFEVSYQDTLTSDDGKSLVFQGDEGGSASIRQFQLKGFSAAANPNVYDVTDAPASIGWISPSDITYASGAYKFQDLSGRRYIAVTDSGKFVPAMALDESVDLKGAGGADEIIITHEGFYNAILPLSQLRENQGMKVVTAKINDIYDEFSGGVADPLAIKEFLKYAYQHWNPRPRYVLLVGDASYDYKGHLPYCLTVQTCSYVPTHLYQFGKLGEVPSDNWFADAVSEDLNGDGEDDGLPEMAVGRIPAKKAAEVTQVVDKILSYETHSFGGNPDFRYLFVADNNDDLDLTVRSPFEALSMNLSTWVPEPEMVNNTRLLFLGDGYQNVLDGAEGFRSALLDALNQGPLLVNYTGHGSATEWGGSLIREEGVFASESYIDSNEQTVPGVNQLTNLGGYPFVVALDCLNGNFADPGEGAVVEGARIARSLGEGFLMAKDKGAVAVWAASALGYPTDHEVLGQRLFKKIFQENQRVLGDAVTGTMTAVLQDPLDIDGDGFTDPLSSPVDVYSTFIFFGDPATRLATP